jgi:(p)ppGpp synthase/HD superfamily hydrolase
MALPAEDIETVQAALLYVIEMHRELTCENGAPTLGTQNQAVDFILADAGLRQAVAHWAALNQIDEATTVPRSRLTQDALYRRVRDYLLQISERAAFEPARPV